MMQKFILSVFILAGLFSRNLSAEVELNEDFDSKTDYSLNTSLTGGLGGGLGYGLGNGLGNGLGSFSSGSIGGDDLGAGLRVRYSSLTDPKTDVIECAQNQVGPIAPQVSALAPLAFNVACSQIKEDDVNLYSEQNCKLLKSCANARTSNDESSFSGFILVPKMAAEDYAGLMMEDHLPDMENLEALRKFSDKKYGKNFSAACRSPFDYKKTKDVDKECDKNIIEEGFKNLHDSCNPLSKACYNLGADFGKNVPESASALQSFMNQRTEAKVTDALASDNEMLESLSRIMASKDKSEAKLQALFSKLNELYNKEKLDPVFGFKSDFLNPDEMKKSPHYDFFKKILSKNLTVASAKEAIEKHRRDYTKRIFKGSCKSSYTYVDICKKASSIADGKSGLYTQRLTAASRLKNLDSSRLDIIKMLYPNGVLTDKDALTVLNAQRCIAMGVIRGNEDIYSLGSAYLGNDPRGSSDYGLGSGPSIFGSQNRYFWGSSLSGASYGGPDSSDAKSASSDLKIELDDKANNMNGGLAPAASTRVTDTDDVGFQQEKSLSDSFSDSFKNADSAAGASSAISNQNYHAPSYNFPVSNSVILPESQPAAEAQETKKSVLGPANGMNDKIAELSKKLSATEENLARLKEEREDAEEQKAIQKKREDELQTIADLKKQIGDLKTQAATKSPEPDSHKTSVSSDEKRPYRSIASSRAPAVEAGDVEESSSKSRAVADAQAASRNSASISSSTADNTAPVRGPSGGAGSSSAASGGKSVLVLTKTDGMTAEKITETINDKIIELGGQSFEIEENGVKIEIVPEVKDGKILLDAKGKPRFIKKVLHAQSAKSAKSRVPASVTDKADLLRREEEAVKRERAEYLKLKNITNQAVQKKN